MDPSASCLTNSDETNKTNTAGMKKRDGRIRGDETEASVPTDCPTVSRDVCGRSKPRDRKETGKGKAEMEEETKESSNNKSSS